LHYKGESYCRILKPDSDQLGDLRSESGFFEPKEIVNRKTNVI